MNAALLKESITFLLLLIVVPCSFGQEITTPSTQVIKGKITDVESGYPLIGVTIQWVDTTNFLGTTTDENGNFLLKDIPIGRQKLLCSYIGYKNVTLDNILLSAGKELYIEIQLEEEITKLEEVVVTANQEGTGINDMSTVSATILQIEEVLRYSGTNGDVARMAQNFAGISGSSDDRNDIIVRGNSPSTVLWQLEGIAIPSPNHWATLGNSGGPISMLNTNNLRSSDFIFGAFAAEYGNATGAVFDLKMRTGNADKFEFLGQIGFNGFEAGVEGPLKILNDQSSFLFNYRYSTLGVVSALGIDFGTGFAVPQYQDLNFKINIPTEKIGRFSIWGLGGVSNIFFEAEPDSDNFFTAGDENLRSGTNTGMIGINHLYFFNEKSSSNLALLISTTNNSTDQEEILAGTLDETFVPTFISENIQNKYALNWTYNNKINAKHRLKAGIIYEHYNFEVKDSIYLRDSDTWFNELDYAGNTALTRAFVQWKYKITEKFTMNAGVTSMLFLLNNTSSFEPRIGLSYALSEKSTIAFGYGHHEQLHPLPIYFSKDEDATAIENEKNLNLDFQKNDHYILSFSQQISRLLNVKLEAYYQNLYSIATDPDDRDFSLINFGAGFGFPNRVGLENLGKGENYGLELTVKRSLQKGFYYLFTASFFNSSYLGEEDKKRNTYYNSNYVVNALMGKEFPISKKFTFTLDGRFTYAGGRRFTPIDLEASILAEREVLFEDRVFSDQLADYIRPDIKLGFRMNTARVTHSFSVDFQNFISRKNELSKRFQRSRGRIVSERQRGFFPDVRYQILF